MNSPFTGADWVSVAPLSIVAVSALVVLLADLLAPKNMSRYVPIGIALAGLIVAAIDCAASYHGHDYAAFGGAFIVGGFSVVFQEAFRLLYYYMLKYGAPPPFSFEITTMTPSVGAGGATGGPCKD